MGRVYRAAAQGLKPPSASGRGIAAGDPAVRSRDDACANYPVLT